MDILQKLQDLEKQAKTEKSQFVGGYYVAQCCREAIVEIKRQRIKNIVANTIIKIALQFLAEQKAAVQYLISH